MTVIKIQDDQGNWVPINNVIKPATVPTLINTPSYNIPASGGDFWIDTVAAGKSVNAVLPLAPPNNTIVSTQIVDNGINDFYLTATLPDVMGFSTAGLSGKYSGTTRNLIETLKYVSGRWLPYYGRLVYQTLLVTIILPPETVFFALFEGENNSTAFTDLRSNPISIRSGTPKISTAQSMFQNGSLYLDGLSSLTVPAAPSLVSGSQEFAWEIALYPTVFTLGDSQGLLDHRSVGVEGPEAINIRNQNGLGTIEHYNGTTILGLAKLKLNQWQILRIERYQGIKTIYLDDVPIYSGADAINYVYSGNLTIGDIVDVGVPYNGMFTGYIQYIRKTVGFSRKQGYGTDDKTFLRGELADADSLDAFKVLNINCDSGAIVDTKGHLITINGAVAASTIQKRAGSHSIALTGGNLDVAGGIDFNFGTAPYSIHAAAKFTNIGTGNTTNSPDNQYVWDFIGGDTSALFYTARTIYPGLNVSNVGVVAINYNQTPVINTWYDLELAKVDNKYLLIFNNRIVAANNNAPTTVNLTTFRLGGIAIANNANLQGFIDSASIYKGIANGSNLTHTYPLRFLARFSGGSPNDELGAVGTIVGTAPTYDTTNKRSLEASALFAGTEYITYPSIAAYNFGSGGFEIAGWVKADPNQLAYSALLSTGAPGVVDSSMLVIYTNGQNNTSITGKSTVGKLSVFIGVVSTNNTFLCSSTSITDGLPHYFRIIKYIVGSSAVTVLVLDGKIEDVYIGAYTIPTISRPLVIGADNYAGANRGYKGNLDDIAIYKA